MSRKLTTVRKIDNITKIENADRVELCHIDGWRSVVLKDKFKIGEYVLFIEADAAIMSIDDKRFEFLRKPSYKAIKSGDTVLAECLRVRTVRLAGQISQGIVMKLDDFRSDIDLADSLEVSLDDVLNIKHYDKLLDSFSHILGKGAPIEQRGSFPSFVPKTDEERLQNLPEYFEEHKDTEFEVSVKYDGSSMSVGYSPTNFPDEPFFVCSRNFMLKTDNDNNFCRVAKKLNLKEILEKYYKFDGLELCIQGELVGPKVNGNRDKHKEHNFYVFRIYDITNKIFLLPDQRWNLCQEHNIPHVPIVGKGDMFRFHETIDDFIELTKFKSENGNQIEGLVFKSLDGETSFKVINPDYLIRYG